MPAQHDDLEALFAAVRLVIRRRFPGRMATAVSLEMDPPLATPLRLPILPPPVAAETVLDHADDGGFKPTPDDLCILEALESRFLSTAQLESESGVEHAKMFRRLKVMRALDPPLIGHKSGHGYYSIDCPPPDLA